MASRKKKPRSKRLDDAVRRAYASEDPQQRKAADVIDRWRDRDRQLGKVQCCACPRLLGKVGPPQFATEGETRLVLFTTGPPCVAYVPESLAVTSPPEPLFIGASHTPLDLTHRPALPIVPEALYVFACDDHETVVTSEDLVAIADRGRTRGAPLTSTTLAGYRPIRASRALL
jgi:hypothetical protein